ncbi:MAG TPA: hypothetical protein VGO11_11895 [Chthoniobacteraceae bacterium]|jgi:hypothetical protein|nr:hypothetical protein [Chthoniobacteraceae bacterium]
MKSLPLLLCLLASTALAADRINHEGRILGAQPAVTQPLLFNTPEADAVVSAMQIMPVDSPWNENVSRRPKLANSAAMIAQIMADLGASRSTLRPFYEMNFVLVPDNQATQSIKFFNYPDDSDLDGGTYPNGRYPIPSNLPIESWPQETGTLTLAQWQKDTTNLGGDRHASIVQPGTGFLWETWLTKLVGTAWQASNGAKFSLNNNTLRPFGWTSGDAAGLPMFPAIVRYDECQRGMVEHAMRIVVKRSRIGPIYPATHQASVGNLTDPNIPAMGQRVRLRGDYPIPAAWTKEEKAVLLALKKYGALVADNGGFFSISVAPDNRFAAGCFDHLSTVSIGEFEIVATTGPTEGPRSPGAPVVNAGAATAVSSGSQALLAGFSTAGGTAQWKLVSGPGTVAFGTPTQTATTATFSQPGKYKLMLSVDDGVHAVAYSTTTVDVLPVPTVSSSGTNAVITFATTTGSTYRLESRPNLTGGTWTVLADNIAGTGAAKQFTHTGALTQGAQFYRVTLLP